MSDISEEENEIAFTVKFLGRVEVFQAEGLQVLTQAAELMKSQDKDTEKTRNKSRVSLFLSVSGVDILEHKTKFMLYTCPLSSISFCGVHQSKPSIFGFVAKHPAADMNHCYLFQSKKFSHLLVSVIGDAFQASRREETVSSHRDLAVEALRHKNKILQKENKELKKRLRALLGSGTEKETEKEDSDGVSPCCDIKPGKKQSAPYNVTLAVCPEVAYPSETNSSTITHCGSNRRPTTGANPGGTGRIAHAGPWEHSGLSETAASCPSRRPREDIAQFPYVEFTGRDSITCPTCQGTGRIPSGQVNELVALIPYSDQRLQPQRTKLYVVVSVVLCLLASSLVAFFMFPRSVLIEDDGIRTVTVHFDRNNSKVIINMTSTFNISNSNFFTALVDSVSCQVLYMKTVIGTQQLDNVISIQPLSQRQMNFTVSMEISGSLSYVYAFCTMASIKVHNIVIFMQTSVKTSYMVRTAQNTLEAYRYIDCGANYTVRQPPGPWL
ncbi:hypothetical protein GJAV_G00194130 [Gymnothorax javanicus]|nr:hypothetical protein GJAV_G00194130 [Gymnothorax javanicus]